VAEFVCAMGMTHNPRIFYSTTPPPQVVKNRIFGIFSQLRDIKNKTKPDLLIVIGNHHITTFLEVIPAFCICISEYAEGPTSFEREAGLPYYRCSINCDAANHLVKHCIENGFDISRAYESVLDHAFTVPLKFIAPEMDTPIIPLITNVHVQPIPSPLRFYRLGQAIAKAMKNYNTDLRVGIIASFNLSLNVGNSKMGVYDGVFDKFVMDYVSNGKLKDLVYKLNISHLLGAGNSTVELLNLFVLFGAIGDIRPLFTFNEIVRGWGTISAVAWIFV